MIRERQILETEEQAIKDHLEDLFAQVKTALDASFQSLAEVDAAAAKRIVNDDAAINALQHKIDNLCVETIALQQPVASDLRELITDVHVSLELERIADHAAAIAGILLRFESPPPEHIARPVDAMAERIQSMFSLVKQAYNEADIDLAQEVAVLDDEIDRAEEEINELIFEESRTVPEHVKTCIYLSWITHNLERIGDRITNISERIVFMATNTKPDLNT